MADKITEAEFQAQIIDAAHLMGYRVAHFRPAQNSRGQWRTPVAADGKGFPDLVLVRPDWNNRGRPPRMVFAELKSSTGRLSTDQAAWIDDLISAGVEAYIWRPKDWDDILDILR
jgi:hypothetical protein